ncbi:MAG: ParB/RepB/Spo0J family partition protein, partial [Gemmataceae bacterium]|nr:ParB/RepB/Spo0J family partition protein [Gemmataceae bacterium]
MEATAKPPRLARGLNALLGDLPPLDAAAPVTRLPVGKIGFNPYQPRKLIDEEELKALRDSIKTHGVLQPLVVRAAAEGYQLIAGERRLRASRLAGLDEVPVHVVPFDDQQMFEAALVENIQRTDL